MGSCATQRKRAMTDVFSKGKRSEVMASIRSVDTSPELTLRRQLFALGFRYRLHVKNVPGRPDIVLPKYRVAILVHGCFWHRHSNCRLAAEPKSNIDFWNTKFESNLRRDQRVKKDLSESGWRTCVVWECSIRRRPLAEDQLLRLAKWIKQGQEQYVEFPSLPQHSD